MMEAWLNIAEATLTASLTTQTDQENSPLLLAPHRQQDLKDLLGEVIAWRALLWSFQQKGRAALALCQQALALLSAQNFVARALVAYFQVQALYSSSVNDAVAAVESGIQAAFLAQEAGATALAITYMGLTALHMIGTGRLRETLRLTDQGILLGTKPGELVLPEVGWPTFFQADILREWNQLDAALSLVEEGISLCRQTSSITSLPFLLHGYAVLLRICLSRGELDTARSTFQLLEPIGMTINQFISLYHRSFFAIIDQVRLWLACEELDRATHWAEELDVGERHGNPFVHEREEVACIRVLLAKHQPNLALGRLEPVLRRATTGQRWGHVIEIRLLQALAHQMRHKETQALDTLSEAVRLAEPEGYIRSFVDEGTAMEALLFKLHLEQCKHRPTPYLDTLLAAFPKESKAQKRRTKRRRQERLP